MPLPQEYCTTTHHILQYPPPPCNRRPTSCLPTRHIGFLVPIYHDKALDTGFLLSLPEITSTLLRKYPPPSVIMIKCHLDHEHKNQGSTSIMPPVTTLATIPTTAIAPTIALPNAPPTAPPSAPQLALPPNEPPVIQPCTRTHHTYTKRVAENGQVLLTKPDTSPPKVQHETQYILVLYDYDSNIIHCEPMPSRSAYQILLTIAS